MFGRKGYHGRAPREGMSFMFGDNGMLLALFPRAKDARQGGCGLV